MRNIRTRATAPERLLTTALRQHGLPYRTQYRTRHGRVDIAFPGCRLAVFVDGCFWHGKSWRARGFSSLEDQFSHWRNGDWWLQKIRSNVARDKRQNRSLNRSGWRVLRFSDSSIAKNPDACALRIVRLLAESI